MPLLVHVIAGGLGLVAGAVALLAAKGATLHRKSGMLFVYAVLTMSVSGAVMAAFKANAGSVLAGLMTAYLAITALTTVRPPTAGSRRLEVGAMLVALALGLTCVTFGLQALATASGTRFGIPASRPRDAPSLAPESNAAPGIPDVPDSTARGVKAWHEQSADQSPSRAAHVSYGPQCFVRNGIVDP